MAERSSSDESPDIGIERAELLLHCQEASGVPDGRSDFETIPDDAGVRQKPLHFPRSIAGDHLGLKPAERLAIALPFVEDGLPVQPCLRPFENEEFEERPIV